MWVEWVNDDEPIGVETTKAYTPESLGGYLIKLEQSVPEEWGRRVSYSRGWPKVPPEPELVRSGEIKWVRQWEMPPGELDEFLHDQIAGLWKEYSRGEWVPIGHKPNSDCICFEWVDAPVKLDIWESVGSPWLDSDGVLRSDGEARPWEPWMNSSNQWSG